MDDLETIPVCKRCCFCIPLRYGLLTWGYVKLIVAILGMIVLSIPLAYIEGLLIPCVLILCVVLIDVCMTTAFIIGGHEKSLKLLRIYYYYVLAMWGVIIILFLVFSGLLLMDYPIPDWIKIFLIVDDICIILALLIQTYFILLLRSEIIRIRSNCPYRFVKNAFDEGSVRCEGQMFDMKKTTEVYEKDVS